MQLLLTILLHITAQAKKGSKEGVLKAGRNARRNSSCRPHKQRDVGFEAKQRETAIRAEKRRQ